MKTREWVLISALDLLLVACILLTLGPGSALGLSLIAQTVTAAVALLLGALLTAYSLTLLCLLRKPERSASWLDKLALSAALLTGLIPLAFLIWICIQRLKALAIK
jgi:hypothetical protein